MSSPHDSQRGLGKWQLRLLAALALLVLAGCSNNPNPAPLHTSRGNGQPWVVRHVSMPDEVRSLDPQIAYDQVSRMIIEPIYDTLLEYDPVKTDPYEVRPCLLESIPEKTVNGDGTITYLCRLRPGVFFEPDACFPGGEGRELVARDVQYAFQRLCDPEVGSPVFAALADIVRGMSASYDVAKKSGAYDYNGNLVSGLEVIDQHTFKLHLLKAYPQIFYWLALHFTAPVAREAVEYYDGKPHKGERGVRELFRNHPVGNGAFRLAEWVRGQRFRLVRNPDYKTVTFPAGGWTPDFEAANRPLAGHALPMVDEIQLTVFRELLPIWLLTRQGYLDRMGVMKDAAKSAMTSAKELTPFLKERGMRLHRILEPSTFFIVFNMEDKVVGSNAKLRQAISCAYDPRGYIEMLYGGAAPVAQQLTPPGIFGYEKELRNPNGLDLEKAHRLLAEAGYPGGVDRQTGKQLAINLDVTATGGEERQLAEYEQRQLEQLGIKVNIIENTFARLDEKGDQGNFQLISAGWGADYPDPENFFFLFASQNFPPQGKNIGRYKNPEFDRIFSQMASMENTPERQKLIHQLNDIFAADCPAVLLFNKGYYVIAPPWSPLTHTNTLLEGGLKFTTVDYALREQKRREWNPERRWVLWALAALVIGAVAYAIRYNRRHSL